LEYLLGFLPERTCFEITKSIGGMSMARTVAIGLQNFEDVITKNCFYVDKTLFIKEWWENNDAVTLITRPRRFGKTLNMNMLERFFSVEYAGKGEVFEGLNIWDEQKYRDLQGTYPVIFLSFALVKEISYQSTRECLFQIITSLYNQNQYLLESEKLTAEDIQYFKSVTMSMNDTTATLSLHKLCEFMSKHFGRKVIVLIDEYDTPMQEAYLNGFWDELVTFTRGLFNKTFKTNPFLERAVMTGITRVSKESMFSDLNNLEVVTTTSEKYATSFGFTEDEVFSAMDEVGLTNKEEVKEWYDGFTFGNVKDIYNPWSIINFLDKKRIGTYWVNTSSNGLANELVRKGNSKLKMEFEKLLNGESVHKTIDEQIVYSQLFQREDAIWSLFLASGYVKLKNPVIYGKTDCDICLTNREVCEMFKDMISDWFAEEKSNYNDFIEALLLGDLDAMNDYMNMVSETIFSSFDTGRNPSRVEPERFYHGFVLGLMVDLQGRYIITSNRESGFGRYDIMLEPQNDSDPAIIIEFKVINKRRENSLEETVQAALTQIKEKDYARQLTDRGFAPERIHSYGFAFQGKEVLIGE
jgi:hypothetical protein